MIVTEKIYQSIVYQSILWRDEVTFKSNGQIKIHNAHYWSPLNPHWLREVDNQHLWSVNTWCGVIRRNYRTLFFRWCSKWRSIHGLFGQRPVLAP